MEVDRGLDVVAGRLPLRVVELDPQTDPRWETLMNSLPTSVIFQHPAWLGVLEETYGYKPNHLACEDATGELRGVLPLFYRRGLRTGRMYASLFDSAKAGPLAYDDQARAALIQAAIERAGAEPGIQLQIRVISNSLDGLVDNVIGAPMYESYELALPERLDLLRLNSSIKRAINKATRLGVQVRQAETEGELRAWYGLYLQTMRRLVVMPRPYRFFEIAWQRLRPLGLLRLLLAERVEAGQSGMVAGLLFLQWGQTISHAFTGWRREDQTLRANDLLHWQAIQDAYAEGLRCYDFGNVPSRNQGLAQFKSKWGAEARMIYSYSYPSASHGTAGFTRQSRRAIRPLVGPIWQHLPIKVIGLLSDWSYALHYY
jgi:CelD/BcsL family acetyltransferase involved in cellulose biosynthesis